MSEFTSEPKREVPCRICALDGVDNRFEAKRLSGHIGGLHAKQGWTKKKYVERWGEEDFSFYKPSDQEIAVSRERINEVNARRTLALDGESMLPDANRSELSEAEQLWYDGFYNLVLQAVDRDEVQMPVIGSLTLDMIVLQRLRKLQLDATKPGQKLGPMKNIEEAIEKAEKRIQNSMKTLCISREMLMKTREQIKSTAAGLISGYFDEIERNSPEALDALMIDEKRVLAQMVPRLEKMVLIHAKEIEPEKEAEEDGANGAVFSLEDALQRAGVSL